MEKYFNIGKITGTHGIKGTIKVFPTTEDPHRFELLKEIIIEYAGKKEIYKISKVAYQKNMVLLNLKGITDINVAEKFKGGTILIPDSLAIPLEEDEFYTRDLYDMEVYTDEGEYLGIITNIYQTGANDVYAVTNPDKDPKKELLLPAIKQCILNVDVENNKMTVYLMEGLRD